MEDIKVLEEISKPVVDYLKNNWDPHCTVIITDCHIKLVRDEIGIPVLENRTAQEVPVQEQSKKFITDYGSGNFKFIKLFNNKKLYDEVLKANKNNIGLILTPEVLKMSQINSIEQIFMIGVLKDR